jgi:hypothetical protein
MRNPKLSLAIALLALILCLIIVLLKAPIVQTKQEKTFPPESLYREQP